VQERQSQNSPVHVHAGAAVTMVVDRERQKPRASMKCALLLANQVTRCIVLLHVAESISKLQTMLDAIVFMEVSRLCSCSLMEQVQRES